MNTAMSVERSTRQACIIGREGKGELLRVADVDVLRVAGTQYEMGFQHGRLLADSIRRGPIPYYRTIVEKLVGKGSLGPLSHLVWPALQSTIGRRVAKNIPEFALDALHGVADGAGLERQVFLDGCTMPDSLMWVAARMMKLRGHGPAVAHRISLGLGCTSAIAWGDATADGQLLHGRNFDYHGVGNWPSNKAVIFHEPDVGHRYVSVAAAGVALGGITAMNERGLTLTVHQHMFTDRTKLGGTPIGLVGDIVMREADNLDEAQRILDAHTPIGCWTYVITDGNTGEVLCYEENPERSVAHRYGADDGGTLGYANIYLDPELGESEVDLYGSYWRHNEGRQRRASALLEARAGTLDPSAIASILGDTGSTDCRVADSIAMVLTVGSVVFRPRDGALWVGTGEAPTSRGRWLPFSLAAKGQDHSLEAITVGALEPAETRDAFEQYRQAYIVYTDDHDPRAALRLMDRACELAPDQSAYHSLRGLFALNCVETTVACDAFDAAITIGHPHEERVAMFHLWRGRARDLAGDRSGALTDYRASIGRRADPPVRSAALKGMRQAYRAKAAQRFHIDVGLADVVGP